MFPKDKVCLRNVSVDTLHKEVPRIIIIIIIINPLNAELNPICHLLILLDFNVYGSVHRKYIQQDATLHILFISGNCSTFFGWYFHPSSGAQTTVSAASGICHNTITAICRYRGGAGTGLSVLW
jgi:hypothetical protein